MFGCYSQCQAYDFASLLLSKDDVTSSLLFYPSAALLSWLPLVGRGTTPVCGLNKLIDEFRSSGLSILGRPEITDYILITWGVSIYEDKTIRCLSLLLRHWLEFIRMLWCKDKGILRASIISAEVSRMSERERFIMWQRHHTRNPLSTALSLNAGPNIHSALLRVSMQGLMSSQPCVESQCRACCPLSPASSLNAGPNVLPALLRVSMHGGPGPMSSQPCLESQCRAWCPLSPASSLIAVPDVLARYRKSDLAKTLPQLQPIRELLTLDYSWQLTTADSCLQLTVEYSWQLTTADSWLQLTVDYSWQLTTADSWLQLTPDSSWRLTTADTWLQLTVDCSWCLTTADAWLQLTPDYSWHLSVAYTWIQLTPDLSWYLFTAYICPQSIQTKNDSWLQLTPDNSWHLTTANTWLQLTPDCCWHLTIADTCLLLTPDYTLLQLKPNYSWHLTTTDYWLQLIHDYSWHMTTADKTRADTCL